MNFFKKQFSILCTYLFKEKKSLTIISIIPFIIGIFQFSTNPFLLVLCPLAAISFYIFETHSSLISIPSPLLKYSMATVYALSSFLLEGSNSISSKVAYVLLPFFVLALEKFIANHSAGLLLTIFILFLYIDAVYAISLFGIAIIFYIVYAKKELGSAIADLLHLALLFILGLLVTAPISFLRLESFLTTVQSNAYPGCSLVYPIFVFISRFFSGTISSSYFEGSRNIELGIGIIAFSLFILFFINTKIDIKHRIRTLVFILILFLSVETTTGLFCMEMFQSSNGSISLCGMVVFFSLLFSGESIGAIPKLSGKNATAGIVIITGFIACTLLFSMHNFSIYAIFLQFAALLLFCISIILCCLKKEKLGFYMLSCGLCTEILIGSFFSMNDQFIPESRSLNNQFALKTQTINTEIDTTVETLKDWPYTEEGNHYLQNHIALSLYGSLQQVDENVKLEKDEILAFNELGILSAFDEFNLKCHKIGIKEDVFVKIDDISISFPQEYPDLYTVTDLGNHLFNIETTNLSNDYETDIFIPYDYIINAPTSGNVYVYDNFTTFVIDCGDQNAETITGRSYIRMSQTAHFSLNTEINAYVINQKAFEQIPTLLRDYLKEHQSVFSSSKYIIYLFCMIIGLSIFAFFTIYTNIHEVNERLYALKKVIANQKIFRKIATFCHQNSVYLLSFAVPFSLFILSMIIFNCSPFGSQSFLDCDGPSSVLGNFLNNYYSYKDGNYFISMLGGYANELTTTLAFPFYLLAMLFTPNQLPAVFIFSEAILVGLSGFTMCYYLTHRLTGRKIYKRDYRLLFSALIYSINGYMLAMHSYIFWWFLLFCLFPIVVLQLERLIYQRKWFLYVILLSICITTNFNIALYICIYLIIHFFICKFSDFKDFFVKAFRFGFSSLVAAGCGLSGWFYILISKSNSGYSAGDSIFPIPGFHTSFLNQWSKFMIFSPTGAISHNPGDINIYMSILMLLLLFVFIFAKHITPKNKAKILIPMLFLLISFNGEVLSYLWNGFHYQSGVPNRFVFIWMFLCSTIAYESLCEIKRLSYIKKIFVFLIPLSLMCICQFFGKEQENYAFVSTIVLITIYFIITILSSKQNWIKHNFYIITLFVLVIELFANMIFVSHSYCLDNLVSFGDYEAKAEENKTIISTNHTFTRFSMANYYGMNFGFFNNAPTNQIFVSTLNTHMQNTNFYYGFLSGGNYITSNYNSTPFGVSSSATKYIVIPMYATVKQTDLQNYNYLGYINGDYYFENEDALSLGYYLPDDFQFDMYQENIIPYEAYNYTSSILTGNTKDLLFTMIPIQRNMDSLLPKNSFQFLDKDYNIISPEKASEILVSEEAQDAGTLCCQELFIKLNVTAPKNGELYLYLSEFISLGYAKKGEEKSILLKYPSQNFYDWEEFYCFSMDTDLYKQYISCAKNNQLYPVTISDNIIEGKSNYQSDGYTIFSIPYSDKWHAYIDGKEVETYDLTNANLFIKTPAGEHEIKLVYDTSNQIAVIIISLVFYLGSLIVYCIPKIYSAITSKKRKL